MKVLVCFATVSVLLLVQGPQASAQGTLGVGLYAPELPFAGPVERHGFVQAVAKHLSAAIGRPVEGHAYKSAGDFERDVRGRRVHFAILGALFVASKPASRIVAAAQLGSAADGAWTLMAKQKMTLAEMKGKVLQVPDLGPLALAFVEHGLLGGNIEVKDHFRVARAPDQSSAVTAVRLGRADIVLAPQSTKGLVPLIEAVRVPPPVFVVLDRGLPAGTVAAASRAILSYGAVVAGIQGWRAADAGAYQALAASASKRQPRMVLSAADVARIDVKDLIDVNVLKPQLPRLEDLFWKP